MIPLYRGFDGLDVSFQAQITNEFATQLQAAKEHALANSSDTCMPYNGLFLMVAATGARGGYSYRVSTGKTGATWFLKKPNARDPWGVRVSCASLMLAQYGLGQSRSKIYDTMDQLGIRYSANAERIGRVDYAVDILAPALVLQPETFVMHSNSIRADHFEEDSLRSHGKSGRVTSVTVGKMPGRQIIVYDKRAEVIARHKWAWFEIWNATLRKLGLDQLDESDPTSSRVWRAEVRAGKTHLKERWNIRSWADLDERLGDMVIEATAAIRMAAPTLDTNRSRWPNCHFWDAVRTELSDDLFEMRNFVPPEVIKRIHRESHLQLLYKQSLGLVLTQAAIEGISADCVATYAKSIGDRYARDILKDAQQVEAKLRRNADRYEAQA